MSQKSIKQYERIGQLSTGELLLLKNTPKAPPLKALERPEVAIFALVELLFVVLFVVGGAMLGRIMHAGDALRNDLNQLIEARRINALFQQFHFQLLGLSVNQIEELLLA